MSLLLQLQAALTSTGKDPCVGNNYYVGGTLTGISRLDLAQANSDGGCLEFDPNLHEGATYHIDSMDLGGITIDGVSASASDPKKKF